jgi:hypothetical protein
MLGRTGKIACARFVKLSQPTVSSAFTQQQLLKSGARCLSTSGLIPFKLADIGEGIAEVELMKWFIKVSPLL